MAVIQRMSATSSGAVIAGSPALYAPWKRTSTTAVPSSMVKFTLRT